MDKLIFPTLCTERDVDTIEKKRTLENHRARSDQIQSLD